MTEMVLLYIPYRYLEATIPQTVVNISQSVTMDLPPHAF